MVSEQDKLVAPAQFELKDFRQRNIMFRNGDCSVQLDERALTFDRIAILKEK